MKKFKLTILGIGALALMLGLNIRHAVNNYGIMDGKLHTEILAQSNSSGGGDGSTFWPVYAKLSSSCNMTVTGQAGTSITVCGVTFTMPIEGTMTLTFDGVVIICTGGGNSVCIDEYCIDFLSGISSGSGSGSN